jgi:hypothetical protein
MCALGFAVGFPSSVPARRFEIRNHMSKFKLIRSPARLGRAGDQKLSTDQWDRPQTLPVETGNERNVAQPTDAAAAGELPGHARERCRAAYRAA